MSGYNNNLGLIVSDKSPFKDDVLRHQKAIKTSSRTVADGIGYKQRRITVVEETEYFPGAFTRIYHNSILKDLSPDVCKILITMAINMNWNDEKVNLTPEICQLERRRFSRAILDMLFERLLAKEKPHWYWVNVTVLLMGHINKEQ